MTEPQALVAVSSYLPFGVMRINLLLSYFKTAVDIWNAKGTDLEKVGLNRYLLYGFSRHRQTFDEKGYFKKLKELSIDFLTFKDKDYPQNLKGLENTPVVLYVKGKILARDANSIAVVGSRKMSFYGEEVTKNFVRDFARAGVTVVSGLARGIDTMAHKTALEEGGRTIAVLGCGLDLMYPFENFLLAKRIVKKGAVVSEYPLGVGVKASNFAARNRIISGLAKGVLVIEGAQKSGTLLTASHAGQQGREVFAVPGRITSPLSAAPHFLLKNGAIPATSGNDVLQELDLKT